MSSENLIPTDILKMIHALSKPALLIKDNLIVYINTSARTSIKNYAELNNICIDIKSQDFYSILFDGKFEKYIDSKLNIQHNNENYLLIILNRNLVFSENGYETSIMALAHDFRMPLSLILTASEILSKKMADDVKSKQYTDIITQNSYRILRLSNNIIDYMRQSTTKMIFESALVNLSVLLSQIEDEVAKVSLKSGISFALDLDEKDVFAFCDSVLMERAILNLISNSLKFTNSGGKIVLSLKQDENNAIIKVSDTGAGIDKDIMKYIFQPFFSLYKSPSDSVPSCGLGLYIVKNIIDRHNAEIQVESEYGKGSTFTIILPKGDLSSSSDTLKSSRTYGDPITFVKVELSDVNSGKYPL